MWSKNEWSKLNFFLDVDSGFKKKGKKMKCWTTDVPYFEITCLNLTVQKINITMVNILAAALVAAFLQTKH